MYSIVCQTFVDNLNEFYCIDLIKLTFQGEILKLMVLVALTQCSHCCFLFFSITIIMLQFII